MTVQRFEFHQAVSPLQIVRAFIILLAGAGIITLSLNLDRFAPSLATGTVERIMFGLGVFIGVSGVVGLLLLLLARWAYRKGQTIEVDDTGLVYLRVGQDKRTVQWEKVQSYKAEVGGLVNLDVLMSGNSANLGSRYDGEAELFGCLFGLVFGLYFLLLESLIGTSSWTVRFKMTNRRSVTIFGYGSPMDELVQTVLPRYLPGKQGDQVKQPPPG